MNRNELIYNKLKNNFSTTAEEVKRKKLEEQKEIASHKVKLLVNRYTPEQIEAKVEDIESKGIDKPKKTRTRKKKEEVKIIEETEDNTNE